MVKHKILAPPSPIGITTPSPPEYNDLDLSPSTLTRILVLEEVVLNYHAVKIGRRVMRERIRAGLGPDLSVEDFSQDEPPAAAVEARVAAVQVKIDRPHHNLAALFADAEMAASGRRIDNEAPGGRVQASTPSRNPHSAPSRTVRPSPLSL